MTTKRHDLADSKADRKEKDIINNCANKIESSLLAEGFSADIIVQSQKYIWC